ncbi:MAG: pilus assembly protein [Roseovarius sp.]|nr:pilus assembly protein [Roseovarius sp.]
MKRWTHKLKSAIGRFRRDTDGIMTVEMVITLPFLFWMITTSFELYEVHRYKAARVKATYTVADMLSREMLPVDDIYVNNAKALYDTVTNDNGENQVRFSVVRYDSGPDSYSVRWSETRGDGDMSPLTNGDVAQAHAELPILQGGEQLIIVESTSTYTPIFRYPGLNKDYTVNTKVFTGIRFAAQLCWEGSSCG